MLGRANSWRSSTGAAAVVSLIALALVASSVPTAAASNSVFTVLSANWATSSGEVGPGSTNAQLVLVVAYAESSGTLTAATDVLVTLTLPPGFTDTTGNKSPVSGVPNVNPDTTFNLKYNLTIASNIPVGTYSIGAAFNAAINDVPYFQSYTTQIGLLGTVNLSFRASQTTLNAGAVNSIDFTLTNNGTGTATQIKPSVSTSSGSVLTVLPLIPSLKAGSSLRFVVDVFVPASTASQSIITSIAGAPVVFTFTTAYDNAYGSGLTSAQTVGFHAVTALEPILSFTSSSGLLAPGQVNNIQIVMTNLGPGSITRVYTTITASSGFSVLNQIPMIPALAASAPMNATVRVFAPSSAAGAAATVTFAYSYLDPYGTSTSGSQTLGFYTAGTASTSGASTGTYLSVSTSGDSLVAGQEAEVSFLITNQGQQPVYSPSFSLSVPSPLVASINSSVSLAGAVSPGGSIGYDAVVSSSTGATGGSYSGTLSITYTDQSGNTRSETVPVAFVLTVPIYRVSEASSSTEVMVGSPSSIAFQIQNIGNVPIYSPSFSLSVPSGLAVTTNSTYSRVGLEIAPGATFTYLTNVTSGPSTSEGAYTGTLVVTYTDQYGNQYSQTFSPGLVLVGGIDLVIQDLTAAQSGASLTVSGTLLNEGQGSAFYLQVTGSAASGTPATAYVGEVDPNTPVPFSLTVPYRAGSGGSSANLALVASYDNNYGRASESKFTQPVSSLIAGTGVTVTSGSGSGTTAGSGTSSSSTNVFRYAVIAAILVAIVAAALYVRRSRPKKAASGKVKSDVI